MLHCPKGNECSSPSHPRFPLGLSWPDPPAAPLDQSNSVDCAWQGRFVRLMRRLAIEPSWPGDASLTRNPFHQESKWRRTYGPSRAPCRALGTCRRGVGPELAALPERQRKMPTGSRTGRTLGHTLWVVDKRPKIVQGHAGTRKKFTLGLDGFQDAGIGQAVLEVDVDGREIVGCRGLAFGSQDGKGKQTHSCWRRGNEANSCQAGRSTFSCAKTPKKKNSSPRSLPNPTSPTTMQTGHGS